MDNTPCPAPSDAAPSGTGSTTSRPADASAFEQARAYQPLMGRLRRLLHPLAGVAVALASMLIYGRPALACLWHEVAGWPSSGVARAAYAQPFELMCSGVTLGGAVVGLVLCLGLALRRR